MGWLSETSIIWKTHCERNYFIITTRGQYVNLMLKSRAKPTEKIQNVNKKYYVWKNLLPRFSH